MAKNNFLRLLSQRNLKKNEIFDKFKNCYIDEEEDFAQSISHRKRRGYLSVKDVQKFQELQREIRLKKFQVAKNNFL